MFYNIVLVIYTINQNLSANIIHKNVIVIRIF